MKTGWPVKKLGEVTLINPPKSLISNIAAGTAVSFVSMASISKQGTINNLESRNIDDVRKSYTYFTNNDILFAKITPCMENGKTAIAQNLQNSIGFGTTEVHVLRPTSQVLPQWIHSIIRTEEFRNSAEKHMTGSAGQQRVPREYLENKKIPVPSINVQKKIVQKLDAIQKTQKLNDLQISKVEELYEYLLDKEVKSNKYKTVRLSKVTQAQEVVNPNHTPEKDYDYVDISSINAANFSIDISAIKNFKGKDAPSRARKKIQQGDVLFSTVRPNLKRIAKVDFQIHNTLGSTGFTVLRADTNKINQDYMGTVTCSGIVTEQMLPMIRGAAYPAVSDSDVMMAEIPYPDMQKQNEIAEKFITIDNCKKKLLEERNLLKELFDSVLDRCIKGEL